MTLEAVLVVAAALFAVGLYGALSQQVVVMVMMGLELMINGVLLAAAGEHRVAKVKLPLPEVLECDAGLNLLAAFDVVAQR